MMQYPMKSETYSVYIRTREGQGKYDFKTQIIFPVFFHFPFKGLFVSLEVTTHDPDKSIASLTATQTPQMCYLSWLGTLAHLGVVFFTF